MSLLPPMLVHATWVTLAAPTPRLNLQERRPASPSSPIVILTISHCPWADHVPTPELVSKASGMVFFLARSGSHTYPKRVRAGIWSHRDWKTDVGKGWFPKGEIWAWEGVNDHSEAPAQRGGRRSEWCRDVKEGPRNAGEFWKLKKTRKAILPELSRRK